MIDTVEDCKDWIQHYQNEIALLEARIIEIQEAE